MYVDLLVTSSRETQGYFYWISGSVLFFFFLTVAIPHHDTDCVDHGEEVFLFQCREKERFSPGNSSERTRF